MDKKGWIIFGAVVVVLFGWLIIRSQGEKTNLEGIDPFAIQKALPENGEIADHVLNANPNSVTLIEYADFQCPGCQAIYPIVKELVEEQATDLQFVFRSYPLSYHANAKSASAAAEAAGLQDRYWDMYDKIYSNGKEWEQAGPTERTDIFLKYAKEIGLNEQQFKADMDSDRVKKKINFDVELARMSNVDATPYFFLDGKRLKSEQLKDTESFKKAVAEAIAAKKK